MRIDEAAARVMREQRATRVWYGNPNLLHDIASRAATSGRHPLNITGSGVLAQLSRSTKFRRVGFISHLGRNYPVFELRRPKPTDRRGGARRKKR